MDYIDGLGSPTAGSAPVRYFAYGSNMLGCRLCATDRAPGARRLTTGWLDGYRLTFDKLGRDLSGKCHVERTEHPEDRAYGVVYAVATQEMRALDLAEGPGYEPRRVTVRTPVGLLDAVTYTAIQRRTDLLPFDWYKALVVAGATENDLPAAYLAQLRAARCRADTDPNRLSRARALMDLAGLAERPAD